MAMMIHYGSYDFLVMPFKLYNAPTTFMSIINLIFYEAMNKSMVVYIDDIVIYSKSEDDHVQDLKWVLGKVR